MAGRNSVVVCKIHRRLLMAGEWIAAHRPLSGSFLRRFARSIGHGVFENAPPRFLRALCDECLRDKTTPL